MNTFTNPPGRSPTELVLWAAARLAHDFDLPDQARVGELLAGSGDGQGIVDVTQVLRLGRFYAMRAAKESIFDSGQAHDPESYSLAVLATYAVDVTIPLWPIRQAALPGASTASVDDEAWRLLVFAAVLVAARGKAAELTEWVTMVAGDISDITDEFTAGDGG